jgi:hypothetical protein
MGFLSKFRSRLELHRLEKKYTTRRKSTPTSAAAAQYVDGEYIHQAPTSSTPSPSNYRQHGRQYTSSSSTFAASQHQPNRPTSPVVVSFASSPPSPRAPSNPHHNPSGSFGVTKHSSWQSLAPSSPIGIHAQGGSPSSPRNSTLTAAGDPPASPALSRNSKGQSWEPPKHGWGGNGTDAFREDKKDFRFDVERDRRSVGRVG